MSDHRTPTEQFRNECELETDEIHFCVAPSRNWINLSHAWDSENDDSITLNVKQARQLRAWLDTVIP